MGNTSSVKWIGVIAECRIDWGPGYRIYIERVKAMFAEYKVRKSTARPRGKR
jgi:putative component of toxin-antitoxin plasmid stabilization module